MHPGWVLALLSGVAPCADAGTNQLDQSCCTRYWADALQLCGAEWGVQATLVSSISTQPELGPDVRELELTVNTSVPDILRLRLTDPQHSRWEVPAYLYPQLAAGVLKGHDSKHSRSELSPGIQTTAFSSIGQPGHWGLCLEAQGA